MRALVSVHSTKTGWRLHCKVCDQTLEVSGELSAHMAKRFHDDHKKAHNGHDFVDDEKDLA